MWHAMSLLLYLNQIEYSQQHWRIKEIKLTLARMAMARPRPTPSDVPLP